jgi:hypothetical protein
MAHCLVLISVHRKWKEEGMEEFPESELPPIEKDPVAIALGFMPDVDDPEVMASVDRLRRRHLKTLLVVVAPTVSQAQTYLRIDRNPPVDPRSTGVRIVATREHSLSLIGVLPESVEVVALDGAHPDLVHEVCIRLACPLPEGY